MNWTKVPIYRGFIPELYRMTQEAGMQWCGGYPRWMASPRSEPAPASDLDLFPVEKGLEDAFYKQLLELGWELHRETANAYTMKRRKDLPYLTWPKLQVVRAFQSGRTLTYGPLEDILANFDFTVVRIGVSDAENCLADELFAEDEANQPAWKRCAHTSQPSCAAGLRPGLDQGR